MTEGVATRGITGRRVLVVGASAGIGQAFGIGAIRAGAHVVLSARRVDRLERALSEAGGGAAVACDAADAASVAAAIAAAVEQLGGPIDLIFYAAGVSPLLTLADTDDESFVDVFRTNVIGVSTVITASLPHLAPGAVVAVLSSETAEDPRLALGAYAASKAALESTLRNWRLEFPAARFTCVRVGATQPTEFGNGFGADVLGPALDHWMSHGQMQQEFMETDHVAAWLVTSLGAMVDFPDVGVETMQLRSPSPVIGAETYSKVFSAENLVDTQGH